MFNSKQPVTGAARSVLQQAANVAQSDAATTIGSVANDAAESPVGAVVVQLKKSMATHKGPVSELTIREPTFAEFIEYGPISTVVYSNDGEGAKPNRIEGKLNLKGLMRWMTALTGHDAIILGTLSPRDSYAVSDAVAKMVARFTEPSDGLGN